MKLTAGFQLKITRAKLHLWWNFIFIEETIILLESDGSPFNLSVCTYNIKNLVSLYML